jgi:hypothetical protein
MGRIAHFETEEENSLNIASYTGFATQQNRI